MTVHVERAPGRLRLTLDAPHGNAITDAMVGELRAALGGVESSTRLVSIEGAGADFSFGASIDEHVPSRMPEVLPRFHELIARLLRVPAATAAVVSGRCLGGGFEIALACDVMFAADDAVMGLPEIAVGAFPPVGSVLLPLKVGAAHASRVILEGTPRRVLEWREAGLLEHVVGRADLTATVQRWYDETLAGYSAAAIARAAIASRLTTIRAIDALLPFAERLYLNDLLLTDDAAEGVAAFLKKRPPRWTDR